MTDIVALDPRPIERSNLCSYARERFPRPGPPPKSPAKVTLKPHEKPAPQRQPRRELSRSTDDAWHNPCDLAAWAVLPFRHNQEGAGAQMSESLDERLSRLERQVALLETHSVEAFWTALDRAYEAILPHRELACIVCGRSGLRSSFRVLVDRCMFGGGTLERYQCPACDAVFGPQKYLDLSEQLVSRDHALLYSRYSEADSTDNEIRTFRSLNPRAGHIYLNWGCGAWSKTIPQLRAEGFDVWGFETSAPTSAAYIVTGRDQISAKFDGVFSNNVIEHFRDPQRQFKEFYDLLKPGGVMAHSSPCYKYEYAFTRFHTLFLLGRSADVLAERTGFRITERIENGEYINVVFAALD
jgi:SAM-dependent methyltransferase